MVNLPISYSDKKVTPFGGMCLMKRFLDQTGIGDHLISIDLPRTGSYRGYDPVQIIESFWLGLWTGAKRGCEAQRAGKKWCRRQVPCKRGKAFATFGQKSREEARSITQEIVS
jgi:hypothetical protein